MTQEEKAKAYDEALERAKYYQKENGSAVISAIFPELKESESEKIRRAIIEHFAGSHSCMFPYKGFTKEQILAWLEKQGETKETICDKCKKDQSFHSCQDIMTLGRCYIEGMNSSNNLEPKFKVGDWVVYDKYDKNDVDKIVKFDNDKVSFESGEWLYINQLNEDCKLWTIKDAKDGDVLINWNNTAFIFKTIEDETVKFHIAYNEKWEAIKTPSTILSHMGLPEPQFEFHPATKEQHDTLMKAMADEGWEFDFKKKELTKIGQKPVEWKQENIEELTEFENAMMHIGGSFFGENAGLDPNDTETIKEQAELLLELAPKQEWSEEDEHRVKDTIYFLDTAKKHYASTVELDACIDWLESIKYKVQPQWKPSDKQMNALDSTLQYSQVSHSSFEHLNSLFNDLKKLC